MLVHGIGALSTVYIFNKYRQRDFIQAKTLLSEDIVEIKGFIGRPETNAVVKYLQWKKINFQITEVVNAHTALVDGLPEIKIGEFEMSGAPEIISILESVSNFDGELGLTEVYDRYPKTKMFQHGAGKELFSKIEMLNKYRIQFPDYPDQAVKEKLINEIQHERGCTIRELYFENLRPYVLYLQHYKFFQSLIHSFKIASESDLGPIPLISTLFFAISYGINMNWVSKTVNSDLRDQLANPSGRELPNYNMLEMEITKIIAKMTDVKSQSKFFSGNSVGVADIEVFALLSVIEHDLCQKIVYKLGNKSFQKWYDRMIKFYEL